MTKKGLHDGLNALGISARNNKDSYSMDHPMPEVLESFPNPAKQENSRTESLALHIVIPEVTSKCPITGQPDFANIYIDYKPNEKCVESKSLKLYILGYRNFGEFHEACVNRMLTDLVNLLEPEWMCVAGAFAPRGGIPFHPTVCFGNVPETICNQTYTFGQVS